jgi:predicted permease
MAMPLLISRATQIQKKQRERETVVVVVISSFLCFLILFFFLFVRGRRRKTFVFARFFICFFGYPNSIPFGARERRAKFMQFIQFVQHNFCCTSFPKTHSLFPISLVFARERRRIRIIIRRTREREFARLGERATSVVPSCATRNLRFR